MGIGIVLYSAVVQSRPPGETCWLAISPASLSLFTSERIEEKKSIYQDLSSYRYMITGATKETLFRTELTGQEKKVCYENNLTPAWEIEILRTFYSRLSHPTKISLE